MIEDIVYPHYNNAGIELVHRLGFSLPF